MDDASFSLEKGEVFGFLGPNGAGKTTVVKLLNGILSPTGGMCRVFDIDPSAEPVELRRFAGVLTEHAQMYGNLTGLQNLFFYGKMFGINATDSNSRALDLLKKLGLDDAKDRKLDTYSTGMRQRLSLARAMMHHPKILFLDEPTSGLDPESVLNVNNMIKSLAEEEGTTIFLCTHQLRYAQEICSTYGLIGNGELLAAGNLERLRALVFSGLKLSLEADRVPADIGFIKTGDSSYELDVGMKEEIPDIVRRTVENGGNVYNVTTRRLSLEEIYFALFEKHAGQKKEARSDA